jgi:hypothetical protein
MNLSRAGTLFIGAIALCASGCGDSHEAVTREMLSAQQELCAVLDTVADDASAQAALPRVKEISDRLQSLRRRSDALGPPPAEIRVSLYARYKKEMLETEAAVQRHFARLDPLQALPLQDALNVMPSIPEN